MLFQNINMNTHLYADFTQVIIFILFLMLKLISKLLQYSVQFSKFLVENKLRRINEIFLLYYFLHNTYQINTQKTFVNALLIKKSSLSSK